MEIAKKANVDGTITDFEIWLWTLIPSTLVLFAFVLGVALGWVIPLAIGFIAAKPRLVFRSQCTVMKNTKGIDPKFHFLQFYLENSPFLKTGSLSRAEEIRINMILYDENWNVAGGKLGGWCPWLKVVEGHIPHSHKINISAGTEEEFYVAVREETDGDWHLTTIKDIEEKRFPFAPGKLPWKNFFIQFRANTSQTWADSSAFFAVTLDRVPKIKRLRWGSARPRMLISSLKKKLRPPNITRQARQP